MLNPLINRTKGPFTKLAQHWFIKIRVLLYKGSSKLLELAATGGCEDSKASASLKKTSSWFAGPQMGSKNTEQIYTYHPSYDKQVCMKSTRE